MEAQAHALILKRVGLVLLATGLIDIAAMIYCIANRIPYTSCFNLFAIIAGIFLLRGSLRVAIVVRWFAVFMLAAFIALLIALPFIQPFDLTLTQLRLNFASSAITLELVATIAFMVFIIGLLCWLVLELGREPIQAARAQAGLKQRGIRLPAAAGIGLVFVIIIFSALMLSGEWAQRAKSIAEQQVGQGYSFHVSTLNITANDQGKSVSAIVSAWNDREIKDIPVQWEEP